MLRAFLIFLALCQKWCLSPVWASQKLVSAPLSATFRNPGDATASLAPFQMMHGMANNSTSHENSSESLDDDNVYKTASFVVGILIVPTAIVGIIGNILAIYIFTRRGMICSINTLLTGLAAVDCVLLAISMPTFSLVAVNIAEKWPSVKHFSNYLVLFGYPLAAMAQNASVWCLLVITLERYVAVIFPLRSRYICTTKNARLALFVVITCAAIYNVCRFFEYSMQSDGDLCNWLKNDKLYLRLYTHWMYFFVTFLAPFAVLLIFNGFIIKGVRQARSHRAELTRQETQEHKVAVMMVVLILIFFLCNSLAFVLNAVEATQPEHCFASEQCEATTEESSQWSSAAAAVVTTMTSTTTTLPVVNTSSDDKSQCIVTTTPFYFVVDLNNLLVEINSSVNFFIYYVFSQRFRKYFRRLFPCPLWFTKSLPGKYSSSRRRRSALTSDIGTLDQQGNYNGYADKMSAAERSPMLQKSASCKLKMSRTFSERSCPSSQIN